MIRMKPETPILTEYYVIFTQGIGWLSHVLQPGFSHMRIITRDDYNWILLNPTLGFLEVVILATPIDQFPKELIESGDTVLRIVFAKRDPLKQFKRFGLLNCLTLVKYMLGINIYSVTPWQFFKKLVNFKASQRMTYAIHTMEVIKDGRRRIKLTKANAQETGSGSGSS